MLLFIFDILQIYLGAEVCYTKVGDFNQHFLYLSQRAERLGWQGSFDHFRNLQYSPILQCELFRIENLSIILGTDYFSDLTVGDFFYIDNNDTLKLKEEWRYRVIPIQLDFSLSFKYFNFFSGVEFLFTNLDIAINKNYEPDTEYFQNFDSEDIGLFAGLTKRIGKFNFELFVRSTPLDQFHDRNGFLFYFEPDGYIYHGPEVVESRNAVLNFTGGGIKILYRIF